MFSLVNTNSIQTIADWSYFFWFHCTIINSTVTLIRSTEIQSAKLVSQENQNVTKPNDTTSDL